MGGGRDFKLVWKGSPGLPPVQNQIEEPSSRNYKQWPKLNKECYTSWRKEGERSMVGFAKWMDFGIKPRFGFLIFWHFHPFVFWGYLDPFLWLFRLGFFPNGGKMSLLVFPSLWGPFWGPPSRGERLKGVPFLVNPGVVVSIPRGVFHSPRNRLC